LRWGEQRERDHVEDVGVDGRIILKNLEVGWGLVLSGSRWDRWRAF